jgi:hypothetical protein
MQVKHMLCIPKKNDKMISRHNILGLVDILWLIDEDDDIYMESYGEVGVSFIMNAIKA